MIGTSTSTGTATAIIIGGTITKAVDTTATVFGSRSRQFPGGASQSTPKRARPETVGPFCLQPDREPNLRWMENQAGSTAWKRLTSFRYQCRLQHRLSVSYVVGVAGITTAAGISLDRTASAVIVDCARMFGIELMRVFISDQLAHDGEKVDVAFIQEPFIISHIRRVDMGPAEMHVIDAVPAREIAANRNRVFTHLTRNPAVKCNSVRRAVDDFDEV